MWSESCSLVSDSLWPRGLYCPWNSPGQNTGVGSRSLLQGILPTQGSNPGLLHCRRILYPLSHQGSPHPRWLLTFSGLRQEDKDPAPEPTNRSSIHTIYYRLDLPLGGSTWRWEPHRPCLKRELWGPVWSQGEEVGFEWTRLRWGPWGSGS